jgi:guanine deaminase
VPHGGHLHDGCETPNLPDRYGGAFVRDVCNRRFEIPKNATCADLTERHEALAGRYETGHRLLKEGEYGRFDVQLQPAGDRTKSDGIVGFAGFDAFHQRGSKSQESASKRKAGIAAFAGRAHGAQEIIEPGVAAAPVSGPAEDGIDHAALPERLFQNPGQVFDGDLLFGSKGFESERMRGATDRHGAIGQLHEPQQIELFHPHKFYNTIFMRKEIMAEALRLATENVLAGRGGPFAAIIVRGPDILSRGANLVTSSNDPTAHAEVVAIRRACTSLGSFQLDGCEIYTTCEPCPMCLGAIYWARLDNIYFAATREDAAGAGFDDSLIYREVSLPLEQRQIPIHNLLREEGREPFRLWKSFQDKVPY